MPNIFVGQTVNFDEDGDNNLSPKGQMEGGHYVITITGTTAWSDRDAFAFSLMPVGTNVGGVIGAALIANPKFRVRSFNWVGFGGLATADGTGLNTYARARWVITCNVPTGQLPDLGQPYQNPDPVPNLKHKWNIGGQYLTIPNRALKWVSDGATPTQVARAGIFIPTIEHSIMWERLLNPPYDAIRAAMMTINDADFQLATGKVKKGQLMFLGAEREAVVLSDGTLAATLVYKFSERPLKTKDSGGNTVYNDWNYFVRDDKAGATWAWDQIQTQNQSQPLFQSTSFSSLFPAGTI